MANISLKPPPTHTGRGLDLNVGVEKLKNVGSRNLPRLHKLGIKTVCDLLWHLPSRYEDYSRIILINELVPDQKVTVQGQVAKISSRRIFPYFRKGFGGQARRNLTIIEAIVQDDTGGVRAVWFNQPYIAASLPEGTRVSLAGTVKLDKRGLYLASPSYEKLRDDDHFAYHLTHTHGLIPVYPETEGVTSKYLRFLIKPLISEIQFEDHLSPETREKNGLVDLATAIQKAHYPLTLDEANQARERLAFDELLLFQIKSLLERRKINQLKSPAIPFDKEFVTDFIKHLPFELTKDQKIAVWEILKDLEKSYPMNRLLEGDVGSGKTVVALIAALEVARAAVRPDGERGCQTVFLAPTEVLANQHMDTIRRLIAHTDTEVALLTSSNAWSTYSLGNKAEIKRRIASGKAKIIIGTHALIQKDVEFKNLGLVVVDEQHRFGVNQRAALVKNKELVPHLLSMTATPIPRTLALTIYGDLDISIIKEKPKNRQKIITKIVPPSGRQEAYQFIRSEVKSGRQVPPEGPPPLLGLKGKLSASQQLRLALAADMKAVQEEYKKLSELVFPDLKVAMLHGKMPARTTARSGGKPSKEEVMRNFKNGFIDILVSTSVIEVGVDIPNATVMMIENAEFFGLAQLHQFRGRIGRDVHQSYCFLFTTSAEKTTNQRLKAMTATDDGFLLAEKDMAIRGPGSFFGTEQSGLPDLAMAALANVELIKKSRAEARTILKEDPNLKNHESLKQQLLRLPKMVHFE
ncbi:MAG: ATP-dependent DNA helicase [Parcubacteria group bacterium GW2011_GWA1_47_11]|nr:MAG: ATP-dependent DNA helicase [Parcubacteria group bacterium GW2011_GWA1_47_11]